MIVYPKDDCPIRCGEPSDVATPRMGYAVVCHRQFFGGYLGHVISTPEGLRAHIPFIEHCDIELLSEYNIDESQFHKPDSFEVDE